MLAIYYICFALVLAVAGPFLLLQKKARAGLSQKFGFIPAALKAGWNRDKEGGIWIHAVSVGEFNAVRPLIERMNSGLKDTPIYVSTTTATGQALARERVGDIATVFYFPFDLPFATTTWLNFLKPKLVAIVETEIWPGFVEECRRAGIAIMTINGRMSPKSSKSYYRWRAIFGPVLRKLTRIGVQSEGERERYSAVGGDELPIVITGNIKLDGLSTIDDTARQELRNQINIADGDFVIVAGSTHEGEEAAMIDAFKVLINQHREKNADRPRLIVAPRHPERFDRAAELIEQNGFVVKRFSKQEKFSSTTQNEIYLLDGLGQLAKFYSLAGIAFVGGTLVPIGGHNLLEPYAYSVPTCCGPHVHKTRDIANALKEQSVLILTDDKQELSEKLAHYQLHQDSARALGKKGREWIDRNQGALERTFQMIVEVTGDRIIPVSSKPEPEKLSVHK